MILGYASEKTRSLSHDKTRDVLHSVSRMVSTTACHPEMKWRLDIRWNFTSQKVAAVVRDWKGLCSWIWFDWQGVEGKGGWVCVADSGKNVFMTTYLTYSTQEYKWVPANCWGNLTNCGGMTCDGLASRGNRNTPSHFMLQKPGISSDAMGQSALRLHFFYLTTDLLGVEFLLFVEIWRM